MVFVVVMITIFIARHYNMQNTIIIIITMRRYTSTQVELPMHIQTIDEKTFWRRLTRQMKNSIHSTATNTNTVAAVAAAVSSSIAFLSLFGKLKYFCWFRFVCACVWNVVVCSHNEYMSATRHAFDACVLMLSLVWFIRICQLVEPTDLSSETNSKWH